MSAEPTWEDPTPQWRAFLAKTPPLLRLTGTDSPASAATTTSSSPESSTSSSDSSTSPGSDGPSSRTQPAYSSPTEDETWLPSSARWKSSGMGGPTGWWTADTSDQPSDASESSWSDIVEETPDPHGRFWLTTTDAEKLLPRVKSAPDGKLDPRLLEALHAMLSSGESQPEPEQR